MHAKTGAVSALLTASLNNVPTNMALEFKMSRNRTYSEQRNSSDVDNSTESYSNKLYHSNRIKRACFAHRLCIFCASTFQRCLISLVVSFHLVLVVGLCMS